MLVVVTLISTLVHFFSIGYMKGDVRYSRYFAFLGFFSFSMLLIVLANNLFLLYVGWELVGICSYLLIGHWYEKKSASNAAIKAFVVNRIGDFGFFIGIVIMYMTFHTFSLSEIFEGIKAGQLAVRERVVADRRGYPDLLRRGREVRPVPAACLAARRDGRPDARQRPDPCRHDGGGRRLSGRAHLPADDGRRAASSSRTSARSRRSSPPRSPSRRTTSRKSSRIRR